MSINLQQQRKAAGESYVAAAKAYVEASIELEAHDLAVETRLGMSATVGGGFGERAIVKGHSEFLREEALKDLNRNHTDQIKARLEQLLRG